jgi:Raf kinase inhibitor-like YbhB/YbcL family protein
MPFTLTSSAFQPGQGIPVRHTCDGQNLSPPLAWTGTPSETAAFALLVDDPDAPSGTFTHWLLANIDGVRTSLDEGYRPGSAEVSGRNDFSKLEYGGPCPPRGHGVHHYRFHLVALRDRVRLKQGYSASELQAAIRSVKLGEATLIGTYERRT